MAFTEAPHWDETETRQRMSMYNRRTRCIDRVAFPDQDTAIGYFVLNPVHFSPFVEEDMYQVLSSIIAGGNTTKVTESWVDGHFTPEYGISVVRGIDQLAIALYIHDDRIPRESYQGIRLRRIEGPIRFSQPVVVGDTMVIQPSNLFSGSLIGDTDIVVDGSTVTTIKGIEYELLDSDYNYLERSQKEYIKPILIEAGAQTAVADFLYRRDFQTSAEQAKGDFLVYAGIRGPVVFYEDVLPGNVAEVHMARDPENKQLANVAVWVAGKKVAEILGNECGIGNRERTKQLIDKVVRRRRVRANNPQV